MAKITNKVLLAGKLVYAEIKTAAGHKFLKVKIKASDSPIHISASAYVNKEGETSAQEIVTAATNGDPISMSITNGVEAGSVKQGEYKFYEVSAELDEMKVVQGELQGLNIGIFEGEVKSVQETQGDGAWYIVGCPYYSKKPSDPKSKGEWKERLVRIWAKKDLWNAQPVVGTTVLVHGSVEEKFADAWCHHIKANYAASLS